MIDRRREALVFAAMTDLVEPSQDTRDDRTVVVVVSEGWHLFEPSSDLGRPLRRDQKGEMEEIVAWPRQPIRKVPRPDRDRMTDDGCEADRMLLADVDHKRLLRQITKDAGLANAVFYALDPRGLPVFDAPIGPKAPAAVSVDAENLRHRIGALQSLAAETGGIALVNMDVRAGLKRLADALSSYYVLGYYSTNPRPDGKYRSISVRVKRPRVDVRARRGYRAPSATR